MQITLFPTDFHYSSKWYIFKESELGKIHDSINWDGLSELLPEKKTFRGSPSWLSSKGLFGLMFLKHYTGLRDEKLVDRFNTDWAMQLFCGILLTENESIKDIYVKDKILFSKVCVKDFNIGSLHEKIEPMVMKVGYHRFEMVIRLSPDLPKLQTLNEVNALWRKHLPEIPFQYSFIKDRFNWLHKTDTIASKIFALFCMITIALSGFGLFSIVAFSIVNRTKEIGIRKVLRASEFNVTFLLIRDFQKLILILFLISLPVASFFSQKWIDNFAYKIKIGWWIYASTGVVLLFITAVTLGIQSIKAALANPVKNLRHD